MDPFRAIHHDLIEVLMLFGSEISSLSSFSCLSNIYLGRAFSSFQQEKKNRNQQQQQHGIKINRVTDVYEPP